MVYPLIVGANGFLGRRFFTFYQEKALKVRGTHYEPIQGYEVFDLRAPSFEFINLETTFAIIAAGVTQPKLCEEDPEGTYLINVEHTLLLAKRLLERGIFPVLFSTDYIFQGGDNRIPIQESYSPLNEYGRQKAVLEQRIVQELEEFCIIRLTKVYGTEKGDGSLFDQMARSFFQKEKIYAATDQIIAPIHVREVIEKATFLAEKRETGIFQFSGPEPASRYEWALYLAKQLQREELVIPFSLDEIKDGVVRPKSVLLSSTFPFSSPRVYLQELLQKYWKGSEA